MTHFDYLLNCIEFNKDFIDEDEIDELIKKLKDMKNPKLKTKSICYFDTHLRSLKREGNEK